MIITVTQIMQIFFQSDEFFIKILIMKSFKATYFRRKIVLKVIYKLFLNCATFPLEL